MKTSNTKTHLQQYLTRKSCHTKHLWRAWKTLAFLRQTPMIYRAPTMMAGAAAIFWWARLHYCAIIATPAIWSAIFLTSLGFHQDVIDAISVTKINTNGLKAKKEEISNQKVYFK